MRHDPYHDYWTFITLQEKPKLDRAYLWHGLIVCLVAIVAICILWRYGV